MSESKIQPTNITKPIQLLAAWLVGLLAIDSCFLIAAARMESSLPSASALIWAAIFNVPLFLAALFVLQTRFRPELQEDLYYSTYINQKTNQTISVTRDEQRLATAMGQIERLEILIKESAAKNEDIKEESKLLNVIFGVNENFLDKEEISRKLLDFGVGSHTWFGVGNPPEDRVVSISQYLPRQTREAIFLIIERLGFTKYRLFDNQLEEIEEDVLIGSYGSGGRTLPRTAIGLSASQTDLPT
ncbi:hypothetical protein ACUTR7_10605 [Delftia sp. NA_296.1]|uniref:hypothetical protein n=1 Tax=Delftia sp. NA_296.1 TaxID=3415648 RepID=UPI004045324D